MNVKWILKSIGLWWLSLVCGVVWLWMFNIMQRSLFIYFFVAFNIFMIYMTLMSIRVMRCGTIHRELEDLS